ncbi:MAG: hypothetical protein WBY66_21330, partial [Candidatus Acidiferrales bacterium]
IMLRCQASDCQTTRVVLGYVIEYKGLVYDVLNNVPSHRTNLGQCGCAQPVHRGLRQVNAAKTPQKNEADRFNGNECEEAEDTKLDPRRNIKVHRKQANPRYHHGRGTEREQAERCAALPRTHFNG